MGGGEAKRRGDQDTEQTAPLSWRTTISCEPGEKKDDKGRGVRERIVEEKVSTEGAF